MPAHDQGVSSFNCTVGADQTGPAIASGDTVMNYLGVTLTAAAAAATLTVFDGAAANNKIIVTLAAPVGQSAADVPATFIVANSGSIHYTLVGAGATAQIRWNTG